MLLLFRKRKQLKTSILEKVKYLRDLVEVSSEKNLDLSSIRATLREIASDVSKLSELERAELAKKIDELFEEKLSLLRGLRETRVRRIKSLLKELSVLKKVPRSKMNRVKILDSQIKLDDAVIMALENIRDILIETVQRGVDPETAWNKVFRITEVVEGYVERLTERAEMFSELAEEEVPISELERMQEEYGLKESAKVENKKLKELMEKYGVEE